MKCTYIGRHVALKLRQLFSDFSRLVCGKRGGVEQKIISEFFKRERVGFVGGNGVLISYSSNKENLFFRFQNFAATTAAAGKQKIENFCLVEK